MAYDREEALGAVVTFSSWEQAGVGEAYTTRVKGIAAYQPGRFYLRELPCILAVLQQLSFSPELVIVDGYVWLDESSRPGLGAFLYDALRQKPAVVGVAKSCYFRGRNVAEVTHGRSRRPLFVTSVGVDIAEAAAGVRNMHGKHRIPTLLAEADRLSRGIRKP